LLNYTMAWIMSRGQMTKARRMNEQDEHSRPKGKITNKMQLV